MVFAEAITVIFPATEKSRSAALLLRNGQRNKQHYEEVKASDENKFAKLSRDTKYIPVSSPRPPPLPSPPPPPRPALSARFNPAAAAESQIMFCGITFNPGGLICSLCLHPVSGRVPSRSCLSN